MCITGSLLKQNNLPPPICFSCGGKNRKKHSQKFSADNQAKSLDSRQSSEKKYPYHKTCIISTKLTFQVWQNNVHTLAAFREKKLKPKKQRISP